MKHCINGYELETRICRLSDRNFILNLFKKTVFKNISEYHVPSIEMFDDRLKSDYQEKRIITHASKNIGMFQLSKKNNEFWITGLFLIQEYQSKGIAKYFMNYFEQYAKKEKYTYIQLSVWDNNPAVEFYKKCGYSIKKTIAHKHIMKKYLE